MYTILVSSLNENMNLAESIQTHLNDLKKIEAHFSRPKQKIKYDFRNKVTSMYN